MGTVTFRSIIIGLTLIPVNAMWLALSEIMWYSGEPTTISLFYNVVFILFWLIVANAAIKWIRPQWTLKPAELLVIYTMLCVASAVASHDMLQILVTTLSHLHRFGPIEARYDDVMPHVPQWLLVTDATALAAIYEGQESIFRPANYRPWLAPLAWWTAFTVALCAVMWGINLLFRKQWTENEKLAYPVIQLPMYLAREPATLFRNRLFWLAFCIAGLIDVINGLNVLFPLLPSIPVVQVVNLQTFFTQPPWNAMGPTWVSFYPFAIGMSFFMPLDLAFSCWFFYFFWKAQRVLAAHIGMHGMPGFPFVEEQTAGGYYAIAFIALWISRNHLARLGRILISTERETVTSWERQEIWTALALILGGGGFLLYFCVFLAGMNPAITVVFFVLYYMISLAVTRMRAELGAPAHDLHRIGIDRQIVSFMGAGNMAAEYPRTLAMFGFMHYFNRAHRGHPMPHGMEGFRIAERLNVDNRRYLVAMMLAIVAGTVCAFAALLWVMAKYGASAQVIGPAEWFGREAWDKVNTWFTAPERHQFQPTLAIIIGLVFALCLAVLRMSLTWWPFHPVGYAVSGSWSMDMLWMCVFVAWLVKLLLLKYGGAKAYKPAVPFFLGLIMGDFIVGSFWNIYGIVMETQVYHFWPY